MIGSLVAAFASLNVPRIARRVRRAVIGYAVTAAALVLGLGFLLAAAFIRAAQRWGGFEAALGFGFGFLVLAAIIMLVQRSTGARRARRRDEARKAEQMRSVATAAAVAVVPALVRRAGVVGSILLPLAGLAAYAIWQENRPGDPDERD